MVNVETKIWARGGLVAAGLLTLVALAVPASASAAVSCTLAANTLTVDVTGTGEQQVGLKMTNGGTEIAVFSDIALSTPQVCNVNPVPAAGTDAIQITDTDAGSQRTLVNVSLGGGPFLNGNATGEGGGDREIEITINGGDEFDDNLLLEPGPGATADNWRMGDVSAASGDEGISLNDAETGTLDVDDLHALDMDQLQAAINGNDGDDILDARGGAGFFGPMTMTASVGQLAGGSGDDELYAGGGDNWSLLGGLGADTMIGGGGDDSLDASGGTDPDLIDGNGGSDDCSYNSHTAALRVDLNVTAPQDTLGAGIDTISDCEILVGGSGGDTLIGDAGPNELYGSGGNDLLRPGTGVANDIVSGGAGTGDTVDYSNVAPSGATVSLATVTAQNTGYGNDEITGTENIVGTPFADTLTGDAQANRIEGGDGIDTISLGNDDDVFDSYDAVADTVDCGNGNDSGFASESGIDTLTGCETSDPAPNTTVASGPPDGSVSADETPAYDLTASELGVVFELRVDNGSFSPCAATCQVPALADGTHTLRFRAVESAGAQHSDPTPAQRTLTVDRQPPAVTIDSGPSGETTETSPAFAFSSNDAQAAYECSVDGAAFGPCSGAGSHTASGLGFGAHTFSVRASDAVGNAAVASRSFTVVNPRDTAAPDTVAKKPKVKGTTVKVRFSSTEARSTFTCKLDGGKPRTCKSPKRYRNLDRGKHKVTVTAVDAAGNADPSPAKVKFRVR